MESFSPLLSLAGGLLIGLASALMLVLHGRIAGISGIAGRLLATARGDFFWRISFVVGLVAGGAVMFVTDPGAFAVTIERSTGALVAGGLLVGIGTQIGGGCTSGHGVCGIGRLSPRSIVATLTFMTTAAAVVFLVDTLTGGTL